MSWIEDMRHSTPEEQAAHTRMIENMSVRLVPETELDELKAELDELKMRYPDCPESSLKWWSNEYKTRHGAYSSYCIGRNKWLREFIIENPPEFKISNKCCKYAKKATKANLLRDGDWDVELVGVRRSEGGVRSFDSRCFIPGGGGVSRRRRVQAPVLDGQRRHAYVQDGVRHRQLGLLCEVGIQSDRLRRVPVQQEGLG